MTSKNNLEILRGLHAGCMAAEFLAPYGDAIGYAIQCCEAVQSRAKTMHHDEITVPGIYLAKTEVGDIELIALYQCQIDAGEVYKGLLYQGPLDWEEE
ncbi:MAG: hypothetical protein ACYC0Z_16395 [Acidobacteriaceae bacterium]